MSTSTIREIAVLKEDETLLKIMADAIRNTVGEDMTPTQIEEIAEHMANFFSYSNRIIDTVLEEEDRDMFYTLADYDLLKIEGEWVTLYNGNSKLIHYWVLDKEKIRSLAECKTEPVG